MIDQGCLEGVDEVYGCHNWPVGNFGDLWCKEGPVMSKSTVLKIKIIGTGGHGSEPEKLKVAIWRAVDFYQKITKFLSDLLISSGKFFVCTLPVFHSGERFNVISESASMEGTLRTFDEDIY
jgi:metal-dependent amidase/aminoacylase/carboxypeptidase family protein